MKIMYGANQLPNAELQITRQIWRDDKGRRRGYIERWMISGKLLATGADLVANLTTQIAALKSALAADGSDLKLLTDADGATGHSLTSSACVGGVRLVDGPSFQNGRGAEYATFRSYLCSFEARVESTSYDIMAWSETISVDGSGDGEFVIRQPLSGEPVRQDVSTATPVRLVQEGRAVGRTAYPTPGTPVSSGDEHYRSRRITRERPAQQADGTFRDYPISWHYEFEKSTPFASSKQIPSVGASTS